jgi:hypothetical protein
MMSNNTQLRERIAPTSIAENLLGMLALFLRITWQHELHVELRGLFLKGQNGARRVGL